MGNRDSYNQNVIAEFRARGGVLTGALADTRMLLLHHVGARSALERVTPLAWWPAGENTIAVLASNYGAPRHPAWYHNLLANPTTIAEIRTETWKVHARVAVANERQLLLRRIMVATPSAASAVPNTQREIPVVVLDLLGRLDASFEPRAGPRAPKFRWEQVTRPGWALLAGAAEQTGPTDAEER